MSLWRQLRYGWRGLRDRAGREQDVADEVAQYFDLAYFREACIGVAWLVFA